MSRQARVQKPMAKPVLKPALKPVSAGLMPRQAHSPAATNDALGPDRTNFPNTGLRLVPHNIHDDDAARALVTRWLVQELAPLLGLDPKRIEIRTDAEAESRTNARGASGLSEQQRIFLHPQRFQPMTEHGRYLLAHELAHAAQRSLASPVPLPTLHARQAAEEEAHEIGTAFSTHRVVQRPRQALPPLVLAADSDVPSLAESVLTSRSREIALIKKYLSGWWVSDGDVFNIMKILDSVAFPVAQAMVQALERKERYWLADNINPPHVYAHRRSVLATYGALDKGQFGAIDLKVFRALPAIGLTTEETEAAAYTLRNLSDGDRQSLLRSENGPAIARIISAPRPSAAELARMQEEALKAARDEAKLAEERTAILAHEKDDSAKSLIDQVRTLLLPRAGGRQNRMPNGADAVTALDLLGQARTSRTRFLYVAERMEQEGLVDELLRLLPSGRYFDTKDHSETLVQLVRSRLSWKNAQLIEDLLSYGLFDWAIRDYEALFAYQLIKLLPLTEQYRFRQRDAGKWYLRLLENLPDDEASGKPLPGLEIRKAETKEEIKKLKSEGIAVDENELLFNASQLYEKKLQDKGATQTLQELIAAFKEAKKGIYRDHEAKDLYRRLVALGGSSLEPGRETPGDQVLREAVVHELDRLGYIDELFGQLPESFLYAEQNRVSTVKIMLARDPARVQAHARELVSRGVTDWMVKDHEAYLAYMCIKALPQDERDGFIAHHAELWERIQAEMSKSQRQSRDLNLYIGDKAGIDRASVLGQLAESATWTEAKLLLLDGLVRMAIAMTEHRFAFERSKEFNAVGSKALQPLVEKYRLWNPAANRADYKPELLKGTRWHEEGIFASLKTLWHGLVLLWNLDVLFIDHKIGARVDLEDVQDFMGGDLKGAHLAKPAKKGTGKANHPDANKVMLLLGRDGKSAEVILPELLIDSTNIQLAGSTLQSGPVTLKNLHLHAAYDSEDLGQPAQAHVEMDSLEASDLLLAKSASMITVSKLMLQTLRLAAGTVDTVTGGNKGERKGRYVPFPLLVIPLLALFMLLALPVYLYKKIAGLFSQGLESGTKEQFGADIAQRTKAIDFSFSSLSVDGLTTSGGQHIAKVGITDFAVRVGLNKATRLRAEQASLDQRLAQLQGKPAAKEAVAKLTERKAAVDAELAQAEKDEQEYLRIKKQILKGGLTPDQQDALQKRLDALKFEEKGAAFIDIGSVEASGISGTVTSKEPIRLTGIHGEGGGAALTDLFALPTATDKELSRRSGAGERPDAPLADKQEGKVSIELGDVHTGEVAFGGGVRTVADIDKKLAELEPVKKVPEIVPLYESLQLLRPKAERYELMVRHGLSALTPTQLDEFRELRRVLTAQADLIVKSIDITRLTLDVNAADGRVDVGAASARIAGIQLPAKGIEIDEVIARGLGVGALPAGGLLNWQDWKKNIKDADGKVDLLQATGVRSKYHGLLFEKATLTGPYAKVKDRGDVLEAGLEKMTVEGIGIAPRIGLLRQRLAGLEEKAKVVPKPDKAKLDAEIAALRSKITELQGLSDARVAAYLQLEKARTPEEIRAAKQAVAESDLTIIMGLAEYGASRIELEDFGARVSGAGDVLGSGFDVDRILKRGVRIEGTGPDKRLLRRFAVTGAHVRESTTDTSVTGGGNFELGEVKTDIHVKRSGDSVFIDLDQINIASFSLSEMLLTADEGGVGMQIGSSGTSSIEGVKLTGKLRMDKRADVKGEGKFPSDFRVAHADVSDFRIDKVSANGLVYRSIPDKIEVAVKSGSIGGIWAKGIQIDFPETKDGKLSVLGSAGIDTISDVDVAGSLVGGWELERGRINGTGLQVDFLQEGEIVATVGDLSATSVSLRGPDGWARFSLRHLSGTVGVKDGVYTLRQVRLGSFEVPAINWRAGTKHIEADKMAKIVDLRVSGKVVTRKEPPKPGEKKADGTPADPKTVVSSVSVSDLFIGSILADHLIYRDGDDRVEIGVPDKDLPQEMKGFKPLYISNVSIKDLEWDEKKGLGGKDLKLDVKTFEASAVYSNIKDGMSAGFALKGVDMGLTFVGPNFIVGNTGVIEKTGGFYKGKGIDTTFKTGEIIGNFTIEENAVILNSLDVDQVVFGHTTYTGDDGKKVELGGAGIGHILIGYVNVELEPAKDDKGRDTKKIKKISVDEIVLTDVHADNFTYTGKSVSLNEKKEEVTKDITLSAHKAWIDRFTITGVEHDIAKKLTTLSAKIDNRNEKKPAFGIDSLYARIATHVGSKETVMEMAADVQGSAITGDNISFQSIPLGKALGAGGKYEPVARTAIGGKFRLDRLALLHPEVLLTDEKGRKTAFKTYGTDANKGKVVITGIKPVLYPNGTMVVPIESIRVDNFLIEKSGMRVTVPLVELKDFAAALKGMGSDEGIQLLAAKAKELSFKDLHMDMKIDRSASGDDSGESDEASVPGPKFFAEPVGEMSGKLEVEPQLGYGPVPDPNLYLPIRNGRVNFEDVYPYAVNLRDGKITLGNFGINIPVKDIPKTPGMHPEQGKYGVIDFREMIEGIMNKPKAPKDPTAKPEPPADLSGLNNLQFEGHLKLGRGKIGFDTNKSGKPDEGDLYAELEDEKAGDNTLRFPWRTVGRDVEVNITRLRAKRLAIPGGKEYPAGKTGEATVTGIKINVIGLARMEFTIKVRVKEGKIVGIEFGDVSVFDQDVAGDYPKVQAQPAPTLKEVNPKGEEGKP
ncbi:MAG: hypothetical protein A3I66_11430 [Burkholderiales bacterium RIFCSPLOWO2_02_FULL_57_36]|nr:MAG: hypothetical protein A3I66_11430 [Burkholderiales bacterium RIFCSPLOWO2_02_FULL_57_36]